MILARLRSCRFWTDASNGNARLVLRQSLGFAGGSWPMFASLVQYCSINFHQFSIHLRQPEIVPISTHQSISFQDFILDGIEISAEISTFMPLCICLYDYDVLPEYLFVCLFVYLSICRSIYLPIYQSLHLYLHYHSLYPFINQSTVSTICLIYPTTLIYSTLYDILL